MKLANTLASREHRVENRVSSTSDALGGLYNRQTQKLQEFNFKEVMMHSKLGSPVNRML